MGWMLDGLAAAENDAHYRDLCERETLFWRWAMPILISSAILVAGFVLIVALVWKAGLI